MRLAKKRLFLNQVLIIPACAVLLCAQQPQQFQDARLSPAVMHPQSAVNYESVARFKLASRKKTYRLGELMAVDAALLNNSNESLFFLSDFSPKFHISSKSGGEVRITPYGVIERILDATSYSFIEPKDFVVASSFILVGCDERAFGERETNPRSLDEFNQNRFVSMGSACLQISRPGTYYVSAEVTNTSIVLSPADANRRTSVGTIRSNTLTLVVTK